MAAVGWDVTMSLDGFIADPDDRPGRIFDWYFEGDTPSRCGNPKTMTRVGFKLARDDAAYFDKGVKTVGAIVAGRRTYEVSNAWEGSFFIPVPFYVVTHKAPSEVPKGTTKFTFVTDGIKSAINQAKAAARNKTVGLMGASVARQCIEAGLLDEVRVHIAPFLLGDGIRLYDHVGGHLVQLKRTKVIDASSGVTHVHFRLSAKVPSKNVRRRR
jgi:dihydrofolate reductase